VKQGKGGWRGQLRKWLEQNPIPMTETSILRSPNGTSIIQIETVFCIVFNTFGRFTGFDKPMLINVYQLLFIKPLGVCEGSEVSSEESDWIHRIHKETTSRTNSTRSHFGPDRQRPDVLERQVCKRH
jgi:hypothetical protein